MAKQHDQDLKPTPAQPSGNPGQTDRETRLDSVEDWPVDLEEYVSADETMPRDETWPESRDEQPIQHPTADTGDLNEDPKSGLTDDFLASREEAISYVPPQHPVPDDSFHEANSPDREGMAPAEHQGLGREDMLPDSDPMIREADELLRAVMETLQVRGDFDEERLDLTVDGDIVTVRGEVDSSEELEALLETIASVEGVSEVLDEVYVIGD
ncbi:BON domain-containing protein [Thermithiobacillus plumbiphilus]|uniref:BON domain-containing protein n=1 Tax=Thermithiobacillus plumbiphilus TaxID=1729899 RepID=A0ABU9D9Q3_9PROT